ncbi:hypothetical protein [Pseudothauera lacus]|uniref:hypothetical protein n=1 Tax=Pseudothauera lacus TaxID=2136175 RepID=UPI001F2424BC|nr:hypothetical protein [Pseudothauera lacus]
MPKCVALKRALAVLASAALAFLLRYAVLEAGLLPRDCGGSLAEGVDGLCAVKWLLVQSFIDQRLGWLSLACALLAVLAAIGAHGRPVPAAARVLAWLAIHAGVWGLVLYSFEPAAVGFMLALLLLSRAAPAQRGGGEGEGAEQPGAGLRVERLG